MSGVGAPGRAPRTDPELLLSLATRIRRVEARLGKARNTTVVDQDGNEVGDEQLTLGRGQFRALDAVLESQGVAADTDPSVIKSTFERLLNPDSPLDSYNLNGTPPRSFFDLIPVSSIGPAESNLLANPHFIGANSLLGMDEWTWDGEVTHSTGVVGAGSARTELTGEARELGSNPISVVPGQKVPMRIYASWQDVVLATPGPFITLIAQCYQDGVLVHDEVMGRPTGRAGSSPDWSELRGEYVVPAEVDNTAIAPDEVRLLIRVGSNASLGTVRVSDGWLSKGAVPGVFELEAIKELPESLDILDESGQMIIAAIVKGLTGNPLIGWLFSDLEDEIASFFDDTQATAGRADDAWTDTRGIIAALVRGWFGDDTSHDTSTPEGARGAVDAWTQALTKNTRTLQEMQARDAGEAASGVVISIDFSKFATLAAAGFTVSYTGPGTSLLIIKDGKAQWDKLNNENRDAWVLYNSPTATNFQLIRGTMSSPPEDTEAGGRPHFYALARVSSPAAQAADGGISDVWCRAWSVGTLLLYRGDIGSHKAGLEYVWASNIPLTWSLDMTYAAGVGVIERQYQVFSGDTLVFSYEETPTQPGGLSNLALDTFDVDGQRVVDNRYRGWGSLAQLRRAASGKPHGSGAVAGCSVADNELPAVAGSTAMMYRTNTSNALMIGGDTAQFFPNNFFEFVGRASRDIRPNTGLGTFTMTRDDSYIIRIRVELAVGMNSRAHLVMFVNGVEIARNAGVVPTNGEALEAVFIEQLEADDVVRFGYVKAGGNLGNLTGHAQTHRTMVSITGMGTKALAAAA